MWLFICCSILTATVDASSPYYPNLSMEIIQAKRITICFTGVKDREEEEIKWTTSRNFYKVSYFILKMYVDFLIHNTLWTSIIKKLFTTTNIIEKLIFQEDDLACGLCITHIILCGSTEFYLSCNPKKQGWLRNLPPTLLWKIPLSTLHQDSLIYLPL